MCQSAETLMFVPQHADQTRDRPVWLRGEFDARNAYCQRKIAALAYEIRSRPSLSFDSMGANQQLRQCYRISLGHQRGSALRAPTVLPSLARLLIIMRHDGPPGSRALIWSSLVTLSRTIRTVRFAMMVL